MSQIRLTKFLRLRMDGVARANEFAYRHNVVLPKRWAAPGESRVAYWQGHRLPESPFIVRDDPFKTPWAVPLHLVIVGFLDAGKTPKPESQLKELLRWSWRRYTGA